MRALQGAAGIAVVAGAVALSGCAQILGYQDIPGPSPEAGVDATMDGGHRDAGHETGLGIEAGTTRCLANGLGFETYGADGRWSNPAACPSSAPICLGAGDCTCLPGATQCDGQIFMQCLAPDDAGSRADAAGPSWQSTANCDAGTCSLAGCASSPPSCLGQGNDQASSCTFAGKVASCCMSNGVPGGSFSLANDGVSPYTLLNYPATVSSFRLDRFEVTVGRFRRFIDALSADAGAWRPAAGSGKHSHLNAGLGLVDRGVDGGAAYELGWNAAWNADLEQLASSAGQTNGPLYCSSEFGTWRVTATSTEKDPINCIDWVEAYAFCIWDGGFLPTEAEWNYAAAGGNEQRYYPWSPADGGNSIDEDAGCQNANFTALAPCVPSPGGTRNVGLSSAGDSRWSQADMAGNVLEWTLDVFAGGATGYGSSCHDCALLTERADAGALLRVQRGGSFVSVAAALQTPARGSDAQTNRSFVSGVRCARSP